jgi:hypothetical protein
VGMVTNDCKQLLGGEGGIRTPDTLASMPHFECGAFNHSATSPTTQYQELSNKHYQNIWCSGPNFGPNRFLVS